MRGEDKTDDERAPSAAGRHAERWLSVEEIVAKGHSLIDRMRPIVERAAQRVRARFHREPEDQ